MKMLQKYHRLRLWLVVTMIFIVASAVLADTARQAILDTAGRLLHREGVLRLAPMQTGATVSLPWSFPSQISTRDQAPTSNALVTIGVTAPTDDQTAVEQTGIGFIWDSDGHVVLPARLLGQLQRMTATLPDGTTTSGRITGVDPATNIAVIRLDHLSSEVTPISGRGAMPAVNENVTIIWNNSDGDVVTEAGRVVATGRLLSIGTMASTVGKSHITVPDVIKIRPVRQMSSAGTPANALLIDGTGTLVGMLLPVVDNAGAVYYGIPRVMLDSIVEELIVHGRYRHPWLGISIRTVTSERARLLGLSATSGAQILSVLPGSPAEHAGLRGSATLVRVGDNITYTGGDIIVGVNGTAVRSVDDLVRYLVHHSKVGDTLELEVIREGREQMVAVEVGARPETAIFD